MACSGNCKCCGQHFDKFNGYLVNLSDSALKELYSTQEYNSLLLSSKIDGKFKHFVLCSDCLEKVLKRNLTINDFKFKNGMWMTSNVAFVLRKLNLLSKYKDYLTSNSEKGLFLLEKSSVKSLVRFLSCLDV